MNGAMILAIAAPLVAMSAHEVLRKRRERRADEQLRRRVWHRVAVPALAAEQPEWVGFDHGYDPYAAPQQDACGECPDISTSGGGDA